ncbi:preprotein translocase subunit SecG [Ahniella affigens]|uniref:Protein-export membrane protein SecG n=1 Tax=Ahniella affigens TaxID=2021234 RepID=A0A2P1PR63_9GAMM|nr:preprotein translocase subunit SecG [Ahniella affigens]AVP97321.1 preprotein translocase subunit SecG [Ahniella affigens]
MEKFLLALYVVVAIAMIGFILMQRGPGAQAGSGFGSGASGTVFGARGSANFLSSSTKWLAIGFFAISIGMGAFISRSRTTTGPDLGVMAAEVAAQKAADAPKADAKPVDPTVPAPTGAATDASVPAATPAQTPAAAPDATAPVAIDVAPATATAPVEVEKKDAEGSQN